MAEMYLTIVQEFKIAPWNFEKMDEVMLRLSSHVRYWYNPRLSDTACKLSEFSSDVFLPGAGVIGTMMEESW